MESVEITSALIKTMDLPNRLQSVQHLMLKLKKENSETVLVALLDLFFSSNNYEYQSAAGGLLWKLKPKYKRNLREDIKRSLQNWNVSVEELPWYFAEVVGIETVIKEAKSLISESTDELEKRKVETYLYWLENRNPDRFRTELNQRWNGRLRG